MKNQECINVIINGKRTQTSIHPTLLSLLAANSLTPQDLIDDEPLFFKKRKGAKRGEPTVAHRLTHAALLAIAAPGLVKIHEKVKKKT